MLLTESERDVEIRSFSTDEGIVHSERRRCGLFANRLRYRVTPSLFIGSVVPASRIDLVMRRDVFIRTDQVIGFHDTALMAQMSSLGSQHDLTPTQPCTSQAQFLPPRLQIPTFNRPKLLHQPHSDIRRFRYRELLYLQSATLTPQKPRFESSGPAILTTNTDPRSTIERQILPTHSQSFLPVLI